MDRLDRTLNTARRRLRLRAVVRTVAAAAHPALWTALAVAVVGRLAGAPLLAVALAALTVAAAGLAIGAAIGLATGGIDRRAVALLVDRLGGTDETVLTAVHVAGASGDPNRDAILARFDALDLAPAALIPVRVPRHLRWAAPEAALVALALALVPPLGLGAWPWSPAASEVVQEGQRLEERLAELAEEPTAPALPEAIEREVAELAEALQDEELSAEDARDRLQDLQDRLAEHDERLAPSSDLLQDLEQAARALDQAATDKLSEALQQGDLGAAAEAAQDLSEALAEASPEDRARAAEALNQAGEALSKSADPQLQRVGEAMKSAGQPADPAASQLPGGQPLGGAPQPGTSGTPGEGSPSQGSPSQGGPSGGGMSPEQAQALATELARAQQLGRQLANDQAALQRSQALNGALEGARQRLGGEAQVAGGQASQGQGSPGAGDGREPGSGTGAGAPGGGGVGTGAGTSGHTWEDEGESRGGGGPAEDRFTDRRGGRHVDDFQQLYDELRLAGAQSLLAGTEGQIDEQGRIDQLPIRITTGDEDAATPSVQIPAAWRDEAVEAIEAEPVPPAYEEAVKQYFDVR